MVRLVQRLADTSRIPPRWRVPVLVYVWVQAVLLVWWAGQYPGLMSPDSVNYVAHVTIGPWIASQSVVYDALVLLSLWLTSSVALLTAAQTVVAALIVTYCVQTVRLFGVRARWAVLGAVLMPLAPSVGGFVSMIWKDVPFVFAEMMLSATALRVVAWRRAHPGARAPRRLLLALGLEFLALTVFRNDGFVVVFFAAVVLLILLRGLRWRIIATAVAALAFFAFAETVLYPAGGIRPAPSSLAYGTFYGDIAVVYAEAPKTFTHAELAVMKKVAPLSHWRSADNCYWSDPLFRKPFDRAEAARLKNQLAKIWIDMAVRTPVATVKTRLCRSAIAWNPLPPPSSVVSVGELPHVTPHNLYGYDAALPADVTRNLRPQPLSYKVAHLTENLRASGYDHTWIQVLLFRGAVWCYLLYIAALVAARRLRNWAVLAVVAGALANQLSVLSANPSQLYRYMAGPILIGMVFLPIVMARPARSSPGEREADHAAIELNPTAESHI